MLSGRHTSYTYILSKAQYLLQHFNCFIFAFSFFLNQRSLELLFQLSFITYRGLNICKPYMVSIAVFNFHQHDLQEICLIFLERVFFFLSVDSCTEKFQGGKWQKAYQSFLFLLYTRLVNFFSSFGFNTHDMFFYVLSTISHCVKSIQRIILWFQEYVWIWDL